LWDTAFATYGTYVETPPRGITPRAQTRRRQSHEPGDWSTSYTVSLPRARVLQGRVGPSWPPMLDSDPMVAPGVEGVHAGGRAPRPPGLEVRQVGPGGVTGVADEERQGQALVRVLVREAGQSFDGCGSVNRRNSTRPGR